MSKPLHPSVLALICQIEAIGKHAGSHAAGLDRDELVAVSHALLMASDDVDSRIGWVDTFGRATA